MLPSLEVEGSGTVTCCTLPLSKLRYLVWWRWRDLRLPRDL